MKKLLLLIVFLLFLSCKDNAKIDGLSFYFESPQPINDSELSKIPNRFLGVFMNSDSLFLEVKENCILQKRINRFKIHKKELDSIQKEFRILKDKFIFNSNGDIYYRRNFGDSIQLSNTDIDTFFVLSPSKRAKKNANYLVLNKKNLIYWEIETLRLEKNSLELKYIYSEDDLKKMDSLTQNKSKMIDSFSFLIRPTRKEFKNILKLKNLGENQQFKKVSK